MAHPGRFSIVCLVLATAGCAYPRTPRLQEDWTLARGYRFTRTDAPNLARDATLAERRAALDKADKLFVVLSFSGGGTRAGALAYGVLAQLEAVAGGHVVGVEDHERPGPLLQRLKGRRSENVLLIVPRCNFHP